MFIRIMTRKIITVVAIAALLGSCVSKKKYVELEQDLCMIDYPGKCSTKMYLTMELNSKDLNLRGNYDNILRM